MADVWIKMRVDLDTDPQVIGIANKLGVDEATVVGYLLRAWGWADAHTTDGHAPSVTAVWLDRHVRRDGFAAALASVGWLEILTDGLRFPDFERHNGETAKKRALATDRQRRHRESVTQPSRDRRDISVTAASTREEKRRTTTEVPSGTSVVPAQRGTRLPDDWQLPKAWGDWALQERRDWTADDVRRVAMAFRNHWVAKTGRDSTKRDWQATWQNWVFKEPRPRAGGGAPRGKQAELEARNRAAVDAFVKEGGDAAA